MYENFFGFNERPFKLVPNPAYLFLSKSHEEALAHLTYAIIQGDGFMEITGEVGTGKTTLCRAFLDHLDNNTKAAYIFNPNLNSVQLLKAINDEFGIRSDADNTKDLIDTLNSFLIAQKTKGKNTILLIDEAQNLTNEVLEQLRLLSNLETARHKLLHIILVGQPELKEKLNSYELRQLGQRISLSCRLIPLKFKEVRKYIQHRIHVASEKPRIEFAQDAYRSIYKYSKGIPRLINMVCDRALLTAFGLDQQTITGKIVRKSIKELTDRGDINENSLKKRKKAILFFSILSLILLMIIFFRPGFLKVSAIFNSSEIKKFDAHDSGYSKKPVSNAMTPDSKKIDVYKVKETEPVIESTTEPVTESNLEPVTESITEPASEPYLEPDRNLGNLLKKMNRLSSRHMAIKVAMDLWGLGSEIKPVLDTTENDQEFFRLCAEKNGLLIRRIEGNLNAIKKLNLPVILAFHLDGGITSVYLTLTRIDYKKITLRGGRQDISIELAPIELEPYWSGVAYIPWKNFLSITGTVPIDSPKDSIITLKMLLRDIGFNTVEINPFYDDNARQAVKEIQKKYGLYVDGAVGSTTKIALYNEKNIYKLPHITKVSTSNIR
jgi:general secretion pathway protein A